MDICLTRRYDIHYDDIHLSIFGTIALEEIHTDLGSYDKAPEMVYELVKLMASGDVHLLLFILRGTRVTLVTCRNHRLSLEVVCRGKVPIAIVFTGRDPRTR